MTIEIINLEEKLNMKLLAEKLNEIIAVQNAAPAPRATGPKSEHSMTSDDARKIITGDLKDVSHKDAAEELGLSYGQVYSARKGFTFKEVHQEVKKAARGAKK